MNDLNAFLFSAIGFVLEILPAAFPAWFPHTGADSASARALWLDVMGAVQISIGLGFLARMHVVPAALSIFSPGASTERGSLPLPATRGVTLR